MGRLLAQSSLVAVLLLPGLAFAQSPPAQPPVQNAPQPVQLQQPIAFPGSEVAASQQPAPAQDPNNALAMAVGVGTPQEVLHWIKAGGNPKGQDSRAIPLLSLAAIRTDASAQNVMQVLLDAGADPNVRDQYQQTPLIYAIRANLLDNAKLLLEKGADATLADRSGSNAKDYAKGANRNDLLALMQASPNTAPANTPNAPQAAAQPATAPQQTGVDRTQLLAAIRSVALHSCATEYWRYSQRVNLETELPAGGVKAEANAEEALAAAANDALRQRFKAKEGYVLNIADTSRNEILRQLGAYPTNAHRKLEGVGTKADMNKRCGDIADAWGYAQMPRGGANQPQGGAASGGYAN